MVTEMCPLNSNSYPGSLALADSDRLFIGVIDDIQKLHIRSVPLGECPHRIAFQPDTNTITVLTYREEVC
jgi:DNA damage-binding protein 1